MVPVPTDSAFHLRGSWRDYAPVAFKNLGLSLVTLGLYAPWAVTASRRHLTERVTFVMHSPRWTGDPQRLLCAFVFIILGVLVPLLAVQLGVGALIARGNWLAAALLEALLIPAFGFAAGLLRFRALGYRLRHSQWRDRRGTQEGNGVAYGLASARAATVVALTLGLAWPWAAATLWNRRWAAMGHGVKRFRPDARPAIVARRFAPLYLLTLTIVASIALIVTGRIGLAAGLALLALLIVAWAMAAAWFEAGLLREGFGRMRWSGLELAFGATDREWLRLALGHVALIAGTLGLGAVFIPYRDWAFAMRFLEAESEGGPIQG